MMWIDDRPSIPCGLCGTPTPMTGTKRCDRCWELESRIHGAPALAQKILDDMKQQDGGETWNRERIEAVASRVERAGDKEAADLIRDLLEAGIEAEQERIGIAPPAPVGAEGLVRLLERIRDLLASLPVDCLGSGTSTSDQPYPIRDEVIHGITKALASSPVAVDEAMVERAWVAFCESAGSARQGIRAALTAALAAQPQGDK